MGEAGEAVGGVRRFGCRDAMRDSMLRDDLSSGEYASPAGRARLFTRDEPGAAGVAGCGVEKGDPGIEFARRMSSDMGNELRRGAISYRAYKGVWPPVNDTVGLGRVGGAGVA